MTSDRKQQGSPGMLENVIEKFFDDNGLPYALYVPQGAWDAY